MKYSLLPGVCLFAFSILTLSGCASPTGCGCCAGPAQTSTDTPSETSTGTSTDAGWTDLIGQDLTGWETVMFGGEGEAYVENASLHLDMGGPLTGVRYTGDLAALLGEDLQNYEIQLEARRVEGFDFFCALTFPIGTQGEVSLILGGWAGSVIGLSSLDYMDASSNESTQLKKFEMNQWYAIRITVTDEAIGVWLDGEQIIDVNRADHKDYSLRGEVEATSPLGLCTFQTHGEVRGLRARRMSGK